MGGTTCNVGKTEELQNFIEAGLAAFGSDVVHGVVLNAAGRQQSIIPPKVGHYG